MRYYKRNSQWSIIRNKLETLSARRDVVKGIMPTLAEYIATGKGFDLRCEYDSLSLEIQRIYVEN